MEIKRLLTNICSDNLVASKNFYTSLFSFKVEYESDWFIHLTSEGRGLELGIIRQDHEVVPEQVQGKVSGLYLTFVVDNVDAVFNISQELNGEILQMPAITFYGQKRMLLQAPEGTVCDISSPA